MSSVGRFWSKSPMAESSTSNETEVTSSSEITEPSDELGLHLLYDSTIDSSTRMNEVKDDSCLANVDLVAVHGLGGGAFTTWTHTDTGKLWLRDLLPPFLANSRILSYGYDASVHPSRSTLHILNYAENLLFELNTYRRSENERRRHIVFIGHSMGGLVIKKALDLARNEQKYRSIYKLTRGIMFMGTPHDGADVARLASTIVKIASTVARFNTSNLSTLERGSNQVIDIARAFGFMNHLDIVTVLESNETLIPYTRASQMIVPESSARLNFGDRESVFSIAGADHHRICKFKSEADKEFRKVRIALQELASSEAEEQACLHSLFFPEMNSRRHDIDPPTNKTCMWLSEHPTYRKWFNEQHGLLWIKGNPGAGKSTLVKYTYEVAERNGNERSIFASFFFHGRGALVQKSSLGLFRSLLHQLALQIPELLEDITTLFRSKCKTEGPYGKAWDWHNRELRDCFSSFLPKLAEARKIKIYIDALDECGEEAAVNLVDFFETIAGSFGVCFSCRHFPLIALENGLEVSVEDQNTKDIETYIDNTITTRIKNKYLAHDIRNAITKGSLGIFQWVVLVGGKVLRLCNEGRSRKYILMAINDVPQGLKAIYRELLDAIEEKDRSQCLHLMQWVCFAERPLRMVDLRFAMVAHMESPCTSIRQCQDTSEYVETDEQMERNICYLSKGLIEVRSQEYGIRFAQFIHQSVNDYLLEIGFRLLDGTFTDSVIGRGHYWLSRSCMKYLSMEEIKAHTFLYCRNGTFHEGLRAERSQAMRRAFPFLDYSIRYWTVHAEQAEKENIPQNDLLANFHPQSKSTMQNGIGKYNSVLLQRDDFEIDSKDHNGEMPFSMAIRHRLFLQRGDLDFSSRDNGYAEVAKLILQNNNLEINSKDINNETPLSVAIRWEDSDVAELLLQRDDLEINSRDINNNTPLYMTARYGYTEVAKLLLQRNDLEINSKNGNNETSLSAAMRYNHVGVAKLLLQRHNLEIDSGDIDNETPLLQAARSEFSEATAIMRLLLDRKDVNVNCMDDFLYSPLTVAASNGDEDKVRLLLERVEIDVDHKAPQGTPLYLATHHKHYAIARLLHERGAISSGPMDGEEWREALRRMRYQRLGGELHA